MNKKFFLFRLYPFFKKNKNIIIAAVIFGVLALIAFLPEYPLDPNQLPNCGCGDVAMSTWFLSWSPFALFHGMNPYNITWLNYPLGANLATNTSYFLYGIILAPFTYLLNAMATYNLLMWLSFVLSATAMYYVVSKITNKFFPAFFSGLFYGFSPYMASEGAGHLNLIFIPFPPLIFYVLYKMFCTDDTHKYRLAVLLSILVICQYMMSNEILATTAIMALIGLLILAATNPRKAVERFRSNLFPSLTAIGIAIVVLAYPIYYSILGPNHVSAVIQGWNNPFHADLLGTVVPNYGQLLYPASWKNLGTSFTGDWVENGSYLGIPLLTGLAVGIYSLRKNKWVQFSTVMALAAWVLSLGPYLTVDNKNYSVPLPFDLFQHVPILNNILASRIAMYSDLFIAILMGFILDSIVQSYQTLGYGKKAYRIFALNKSSHKKLNVKIMASLVVTGIVLVSLIPNWPYHQPSPENPNSYSKFFTTKDVNAIPYKAVTLTYPYPIVMDNGAMVWQLLAGMRFRLLGGYAIFTIPPGDPSELPAVFSPSGVESAFSYFADQNTFPLNSPPPKSALNEIKTFVTQNKVQAIIIDKYAPNANLVINSVEASFGLPRITGYGIDLWVIHK